MTYRLGVEKECTACGGSGFRAIGVIIDHANNTYSRPKCPRCRGHKTIWVVTLEEAVPLRRHELEVAEAMRFWQKQTEAGHAEIVRGLEDEIKRVNDVATFWMKQCGTLARLPSMIDDLVDLRNRVVHKAGSIYEARQDGELNMLYALRKMLRTGEMP